MKKWLHHPIFIGLIILIIALGIFQRKLGWGVLDVTNYSWLQTTLDSYTEYLSWEFYRETPLHFPVVGTLEKYEYPSRSGIGVTGAVPVLAMPLRLVSDWLPVRFQHFGWWMLGNYFLLAWFGVKLVKTLRISPPLWQILGGTWFLISPAFITRSGHLALCAHWLILWAIYIYYKKQSIENQYKQSLWNVGVAALIQPYLLVMCVGIHIATLWKGVLAKQIPTKRAVLFFLLYFPLVALCWYIAGNFNISLSSNSAAGYGVYSANLNVLWNSTNFAQIFPGFPWATTGQYEGYSYLGGGTLILLGTMGLYYVFTRQGRFMLNPIWVLVGLMAFYALSNVITFNEHIILKYFGFPKFITDTFRGSARFVWVLHYFLIFVAIKMISDSRLPLLGKHFIFVLAFATQVYDLKEFFYADHYQVATHQPKIDIQAWTTITQGSERLIMYPPYQWGYVQEYDFLDFANVAVENNLDITAGYLARNDKKARKKYTQKLDSLLDAGVLTGEENAIFVSNIQNAYRLDKLYKKNLIKAYQYEQYVIGVPLNLVKNIEYLDSHPERFVPVSIVREGIDDFLKKHYQNIVLMVIRDEGTYRLCDHAKEYLRNAGAKVDSLAFKDAYIGVFTKGKIVFDAYSKNYQIEKQWQIGEVIDSALFLQKPVTLKAWRYDDNTTEGTIFVDNQQVSPNLRGFNFVVLDTTFQVVETAVFDTFQDCYRLKMNN